MALEDLFSGMNIFGARVPSYLPTLLDNDPEALAKLKQQSLISGLLGAGATYLAQPKNQRYGSALPYLGKAFLGGMQSSQGVYDQATKDYLMNQQIQEMKDKQAENAAWKSIQDKLVTTTPAVTAQVPVSGGNAPSTEQVAPEVQAPVPSLLTSQPTEQPQVSQTPNLLSNPPVENAPVTTSSAPNYNVVKQPDVMQTQVVTPEQTAFNKDLLTKFVLQHPTNESAKAVLSNMEALKKLNAPEKGFRLLTIEEKQSRGLPLESQFQIGADNKVELVSGTEQKVPDIVQLQNQRDKLVSANNSGQNTQRINEIQAEIDHKIGKDQDPPIQLTNDAKRTLARTFLDTGNIAIMGMGKNASSARNEIYNMAADMGKAEGLTTDQISAKINENKQNFAASSKALKEFTSGADAKTVRSLNVVVSHLDTLNELAQGLDSNDTRIINRVRNAYRVEFGKPAPTSFNAAKEIVGDEIIKSIVARGGTLEDRQAMKKTLDAASSPEQLQGVITAYQKLLGGQLAGFEKSYTASTNRTDFKDRFLNPRTIKTLPAPDIGANKPISNMPAIGEIRNGWKFKGGNPADKNSWEKS